MAKISQEKKLEALKGWLKENDVKYVENYVSSFGFVIDVKIPRLMIAIFVSTGDKEWEQARYTATLDSSHHFYQIYKPFFIRPDDTKAFTLEKISDCCYNRFLFMTKRWERRRERKLKKAGVLSK